MHHAIDGSALLALWEQGLVQAPARRADVLLRAMASEDAPAPGLGARNAGLARAHTRLFGRELALRSQCPACATAVEFAADCEVLVESSPTTPLATTHRLLAHGHVLDFRLPDGDDLAAAAGADDDAFARALLQRCVLACSCAGVPVAADAVPLPVLDALSQRMEALDPAASLAFDVACPQCAQAWQARLDLGQLLWQKLQVAAERLLVDIDRLAHRYGWTEGEVLRLSPLRRAAYLQMAAA